MPDWLQMLRMASIFNPQQGMLGNDMPSQGGITGRMPMNPGIPQTQGIFPPKQPSPFENISFGAEQPLPSPSPVMGPSSPSDDIQQRMSRLYTPETGASDRFNELLQNYPQYEKPGFLRRIAAALSAFGPGGHNTGMQVLDFNNIRKMEDWKNQVGPAQQAANLERQTNVNERTMAYQTIAQQLRAEADAAREQNNQKRTEIAQQRANVYEFKARNPNVKFDFSGPTVLVANPATGKVESTGVPTGSLSDADKLMLQQENRIEAIRETGGQARQTEELRQTGREGLAETRGWTVANIPDPNNPGQMIGVKINQITGETVPIKIGDTPVGPISRPSSAGITGTKGELPTQTKVRQFNAARQVVNTRPDLAKFVKLGTGSDFQIVPSNPSAWTASGRGPTPQQAAELNQLIYGGDIPIQQPGRTGAPSNVSPTKPTTPTTPQASVVAPQGKVLVMSPDGRRGFVRQEQLQAALAQGYKQVQ